MISFNLSKAKAGAKICTADGRPARLLSTDLNNKILPIAVAIKCSDGKEIVRQYTKDGLPNPKLSECKDKDTLVMASASKVEYVNIYWYDGHYGASAIGYVSEKDARECAGMGYIDTVKVTRDIPL